MTQPTNTAKEVTLYFFKKIGIEVAPKSDFARTIMQAKALLFKGYNFEDIKDIIDHIVDVKRIKPYSLGYVVKSSEDIVAEIMAIRETEKLKEQVAVALEQYEREVGMLNVDDESTKRNKRKAEGLGSQSRLRKKYSFDLFEGRE